jgi:hypothetical protein
MIYTAKNNDNDTPLSSDGEFYDILYTPITSVGTIKDSTAMKNYFNKIVVSGQTPQEWMASDKKDEKLFLGYFKLSDRNVHTDANNYKNTLSIALKDWDYIRS